MSMQEPAFSILSQPVAPGRISPVPGAAPLESILSAVREMVPALRANARETELQRRVSADVSQQFHDIGVYRLMQPGRFGGYEYGFTALLDVISEIGRGCASASWAGTLGAIHGWLLSLFPEQAQVDVWGANPKAIMCGSYAPSGTVEAAEGGWRISGQWKFASNVDNSDWAVLGALLPPSEKGGAPVGAFLLVPRSDWSILDDWQVAGQAGTGSKSVLIEQPVFVPAHRKLGFGEAGSGNPPGAQVHANPIYRIPFLGAIPLCLVAPMIGNAQHAVESFVDSVASRVTRGGVAGAGNRVAQFPQVQSRAASAAAAVDAARLVVDRDTADLERAAVAGGKIPIDIRIRCRRGHTFATKLCLGAIQDILANVGASGMALDNPVQRIWRDGTMISAHITLNWDGVSSMVGQHMLGLEPKGAY